MLQSTFQNLAKNYSDNNELIDQLWAEIEKNHSHIKRQYHTLKHLEHILEVLLPIKNKIECWVGVLFALFFHDIIYNVTKHKNEEMSSEFAGKKLQLLKVPDEIIRKTRRIITATKKHEPNGDMDVNYFTDADLSILGSSPLEYTDYCNNIRKEYSIFPDPIYIPGRKKVIDHFLQMERIFKTDYFFNKFETQARINLQSEFT